MFLPKIFSASPESCPVKRMRRKEARPGELLNAALDLFVEKGFAATRVEEVARRAGVSKGTLFLYFPSKDELFKAVVRENLSGRFTSWNQEFETYEGTTAEMIGYCMSSWWEQIGATRAASITKLMISEARNFPEIAAFYQREVIEPGQGLIRRMLQRGIDNGEFRPMNLDYAVFSIVAPMVFLILSRHSAGVCIPDRLELDPDQYIASQVDIVLHGVSAASAPTAPRTPPTREKNSGNKPL